MRRALLVVLSLAIAASSGSLLANGDFEKGLDGWTNWGGVADSIARSGKRSCRATSDTNAWAGASQIVALPEGVRTVVLSGWIMSEGVHPGPEDWNKARLGLDFLDARDSIAGGWQMVAGQTKGRIPWTRVQRTYQVPEGAAKVKVICALANASGTFRCDDIELNAVP